MEIFIPFKNSYKKDSLPLLTVFMLIVDVVVFISLEVKSDGYSSLTIGDGIVISVVGVFTLCILVADVIYFVTPDMSGRLCSFYKKTEANSDFVCSKCHDESNDDTVKLKCEHDFHAKCTGKYINQPMNDYACPLSRKPLEQFKESWVAKLTTKTKLVLNWILNWSRLCNTDNNEEGPVSIV